MGQRVPKEQSETWDVQRVRDRTQNAFGEEITQRRRVWKSDGFIVATKRVMTVERRGPAVNKPSKRKEKNRLQLKTATTEKRGATDDR